MAPQFCDDCGTILDESAEANIQCDLCGKHNTNRLSTREVVSVSNKFPSSLRTRLKSNTQVLTLKDRENKRRIQQDCLKCDAKEITWSELQLRSADEGTTIFYRCTQCGHR
ncbi:hypothetical protein EMCG_05147 [[Emmonsia] crescens]|uniref:DNA-directed RNA polymerase subunit n=1 Tax=[Emmonsia] crescens TaxID=73230 RepID=A0A0G2HPV7_9EURO|nr:hypothetical protein EMCG_05147 [Emmonsia crescens UAMH 3008]